MRVQVLLSDVDIVTLRNPFPHLRRDCDVEAMSDGWDNATAYGAPAPHMRAACFACCAMLDVRSLQVFALSSSPYGALPPTCAPPAPCLLHRAWRAMRLPRKCLLSI